MTDADRLNDAEKLIERHSRDIPREVLYALRFVFDLARHGLDYERIALEMKAAPPLSLDDDKVERK